MAKAIHSPRGTLGKYAYLTEPDTKFNSDGEYKCNHTVPLDAATKAFIQKLEDAYKEAYDAECAAKGKKKLKCADMPWEIDEDEETVTFKYKLKAKIESKKKGKVITRRVKLFDAKGKLIPNVSNLRIGAGTVAKLAFNPYFWFSPSVGFGLQLQLEACQIISLVEYGGSEVGFEEEEDGDFDAESVEGDGFDDESDDDDDEDDSDDSDDADPEDF
jgi:hypothetical protein